MTRLLIGVVMAMAVVGVALVPAASAGPCTDIPGHGTIKECVDCVTHQPCPMPAHPSPREGSR